MTVLPGMVAAALLINESRWLIPLLSISALLPLILSVCLRRPASVVRGYLVDSKGKRITLYAENLIGSGRKSDIRLKTITEPKYGFIKIADDGAISLIPHKGMFYVNGRVRENPFVAKSGDKIRAEKDIFIYEPPKLRREAGGSGLLSGIICITFIEFIIITTSVKVLPIISAELFWRCFAAFLLCAIMGPMYFILCLITSRPIQPVTLAALLVSALSLAVTAAYTPGSLIIQSICIVIGMILHLVLEFFLRREKLLPALRYGAVILALALLALNVLNASSLLGARNWLNIGGINFQPSELVKVSLVICGAVTMKSSVRRIDKLIFMAFSAVCVICMAVISDFGTAAVFFFAYLVMIWMRSGFADIILSLAAAASGCGLVAIIKKDAVAYAVARVLNWGSAWENVLSSGYQQTRAMMAAASGGMFGVGVCRGWLSGIFAAGSDMPFAVLWEELGFVCAAVAVLSVTLIVYEAVKSSCHCSSGFLSVASCGAAAVLCSQAILNVCGTMDMLPFTGITFPFLSTGGTSMIACWLLLAFITAANERSRVTALREEGGQE